APPPPAPARSTGRRCATSRRSSTRRSRAWRKFSGTRVAEDASPPHRRREEPVASAPLDLPAPAGGLVLGTRNPRGEPARQTAADAGGGMRTRTWLPLAVGVLTAIRLDAQTVTVSKLDEATYRHAITEERRNIFAANLALGPEEREGFWTIYDENDRERFSLLQRYAQSYANLSDDQAMALALASGKLQVSEVELRLKYAASLRRKMSGRVAARFFQIDDYVTTAMRMNFLSGVPLVAPTP